MKTTMIKNTASTTRDETELSYLVREPTAKAGKGKAIILLHGVGSNEEDLFRLAQQLPGDFWILSPRGPFSAGPGRYAWYGVDFSTGKPVINAGQEAYSRDLIRMFIRQIKQKYSLEEVYLGGFSQGAIMSYSIGLTTPKEVNGIIALSGRVLDEIKPFVKKREEFGRLKVFVAHGLLDNTLPIHYARGAQAYLLDLKLPVSYHEYQLGHQINEVVLEDMIDWLK
ncbi:esterase [Rhodocytophaga aerolata]|uniref:Esterase n=1 Tax=Rhodocytophaga aerolata TaxID=455078 RepID=A0ABT8RAU4_9BACT|nr:alpha/beta fold hydrolase [Rhodocytophaga aerolata]MDO1449197.1 esterase [Rhodocytophaga aerolata]